jgi:hypothetical protein
MYPSRRRLAFSLMLALTALAVLALGAGAGWATLKPKPKPKLLHLAGTWSGKYSGGYTGKFTIHWTQKGSKLTGTIKLSSPPGTFNINGSVHGSAINFGALSAGATYTGSVSGKSMSGHYTAAPQGGSWRATKTS